MSALTNAFNAVTSGFEMGARARERRMAAEKEGTKSTEETGKSISDAMETSSADIDSAMTFGSSPMMAGEKGRVSANYQTPINGFVRGTGQ